MLEYSHFSHKLRFEADYGLMPIGDQISLLTDLIRSLLTDSRLKDADKQYIKDFMAQAIEKL